MTIAKHYKGGLYEIVGHGYEEASHIPIVVYRVAHTTGMENLYTRTRDKFYGNVEVDGKLIKRFTIIGALS